MSTPIVRKTAAFFLAAGLTLSAGASFAASATKARVAETPAFEQVDSITMFRGPHSWQAVDDDTVIVWATAFDPYLVELAFRSPDLRFAEAIGVTQFGSRVYAKFDAVTVAGFRYPIASIYRLSREEARNFTRGT
jgi:Family of unknown function (DUF6491)